MSPFWLFFCNTTALTYKSLKTTHWYRRRSTITDCTQNCSTSFSLSFWNGKISKKLRSVITWFHLSVSHDEVWQHPFKARFSNTCRCTPNTKPGTIGNAKDWAPVTLLGLTCLKSSSDAASMGTSSASLCVRLPYAGNNGAHVKSNRYTRQKLLALSKHNLLQASLYIILVEKRKEHIFVTARFCFAAVATDVLQGIGMLKSF